jgi:hypothetical protein
MASSGPNSAGTGANVTGIGTIAWTGATTGVQTQGDSNLASAALFASTPYTNYLQATNFGFSIPTGATIDGIVAEVYRYATSSGNVKDNAVKIVKGGAIQTTDLKSASAWPLSGAYASYGGASNLWGTTWAASDINASNFGVALAAWFDFFGGGDTPTVDHVRLTVYYTAAAGGMAHRRRSSSRTLRRM